MSPLRWRVWQEELKEHPDTEWVEFLVRGIRDGFRLGRDQSKVVLERRGGTRYEATQHSGVIGNYLEKEVSETLLFNQGLAESTRRRYDSVWKKYSTWCKDLEEAPLPVTEEKAVGYVVTLACEGVKPATAKYHLAGLRQAHI